MKQAQVKINVDFARCTDRTLLDLMKVLDRYNADFMGSRSERMLIDSFELPNIEAIRKELHRRDDVYKTIV